jgi:hypothetical protein
MANAMDPEFALSSLGSAVRGRKILTMWLGSNISNLPKFHVRNKTTMTKQNTKRVGPENLTPRGRLSHGS